MKIIPEAHTIIIEVLVEMLSFRLIIIKGTAINNPEMMLIINRVVNEIIRNDQKFLTAEVKNSGKVKYVLSFLNPLNIPPARKIFRMKPTNIMNNNPDEKKETMTFKVDPRSVNSSVLKPSASFSVIMLLPNADFKAPLSGIASIETRINVISHVIKIPLQDLTEVLAPDINDVSIFIKYLFIAK
jgi:hypothetical protein